MTNNRELLCVICKTNPGSKVWKSKWVCASCYRVLDEGQKLKESEDK